MTTIRRINRIFRQDGRALIVAMDHGLIDGPVKGLENPGKTIAKIISGGADAVLTSYGVALRFSKELSQIGLILRADSGSTSLGKMDGPSSLVFSVEQALRLGADALVVSGYPGGAKEAESLENIAAAVCEAHAWGRPRSGRNGSRWF